MDPGGIALGARLAIREEVRRRTDGERLLALFDALDADAATKSTRIDVGTAAA